MKQTIIILLSLLLLVSSAMATDTRVMTMGDNNSILLDEANVWLYPSRINYYPDLAELELAESYYYDERSPEDVRESSGIERIGVNLKFGGDKPYVIGLYLHDNAYYRNNELPPNFYGTQSSNKRIDLLYGRQISNIKIGLRVGYIHSSYENLSPPGPNSHNANSFSQWTLEGGATYQDKLDVMLGIETFSFTDMVTVQLNNDMSGGPYGGMENHAPDGNSKFYFNARYFYELNPTVTAVPHIGFSTGTYKWTESDWIANRDSLGFTVVGDGGVNYTDEASETKVTEFTIGSGLHYSVSSKVLTVLDIGLNTMKVEEDYTNVYTRNSITLLPDSVQTRESETTWTSIPYIKLGFEADVFRWLDVRFGATSYWQKYTTETTYTTVSKSTSKRPVNQNYLGFGFHWGQFHVDTYANPELFINGFDFISGNGDGRMNFKISAVYEMH